MNFNQTYINFEVTWKSPRGGVFAKNPFLPSQGMLRPILRLEKKNLVNLVLMLRDFISTNINSIFSKIINLSLGERDVTY